MELETFFSWQNWELATKVCSLMPSMDQLTKSKFTRNATTILPASAKYLDSNFALSHTVLGDARYFYHSFRQRKFDLCDEFSWNVKFTKHKTF